MSERRAVDHQVSVRAKRATNAAFNLANGTYGTGTNGGDIYTGLDRFAQLIETICKPGTGCINLVQSSDGRNRFVC